MAVEKTLLTADDMARMPDGGKRYELVRGELRDLPAGGWEQGIVSSRLDRRVGMFVEAVEWREDKADPALLLVDANAAGAGMDGIYSAAREIGETELFDVALELARQQLGCDSENSCKALCQLPENFDKCSAIAKQLNLQSENQQL